MGKRRRGGKDDRSKARRGREEGAVLGNAG